MNSKKAITLLVLLTLILGMIPLTLVSALSTPTITKSNGTALPTGDLVYKGDKLAVIGDEGDVPSGEVVTIYWDDSTIAWNGVKGKLNQTTADSDGSYEVWFKVPEAVYGNHYVWVKSGTLEPASKMLAVRPKISLSATSGLNGDKTDVTAYGFTKETDMAVFFVSTTDRDSWLWVSGETSADHWDSDIEISGTLATRPVQPNTVLFWDNGYAPIHDVIDDGKGGLYYDADDDGVVDSTETKVGTINYVTGSFDIDYGKVSGDPMPYGAVYADYYAYVQNTNNFYLLSSGSDSNSLGTFVKRVTVPSATPNTYYIAVMDAKGYNGYKEFKLGSVITLSKEAGPVGTLVRIEGRGFTIGGTTTIPEAAGDKGTTAGVSLGFGTTTPTYWKCKIADYDPLDKPLINAAGEFRLDIYIPDPDDTSEDFWIVVNDGIKWATADFEVTDEPEIKVEPNYGAQGARVMVTGTNFVNLKDEKIYFYLWNQDTNEYVRTGAYGDWDSDFAASNVKVNADGSFSKELRVPTQIDGTYDLLAIYCIQVTPSTWTPRRPSESEQYLSCSLKMMALSVERSI